MAQIEKVNAVIQKLKRLEKKYGPVKTAVIVGYTANYTIFVHEDMEAHHTVGQAKFLEEPARRLSKQLGKQIAEDVKQGRTMEQALLRAGLRLQRASQEIVPVEWGNLRGSAFTRLESEGMPATTYYPQQHKGKK